MNQENQAELTALVLQGGGALGAYQAGAYTVLAQGGHEPDWLAGVSIGAINSALIAGNPPQRRVERLEAFWTLATSGLPFTAPLAIQGLRPFINEASAFEVMLEGVPGFFTPRALPAPFQPSGSPGAISFYDTSPLRRTLLELVDFDYLNTQGPRLSVGAVDIETGNFVFFDSHEMRIGPEHVMASGALPPGFPPVEVGGRFYWDGGLVSNTPLEHIFEHAPAEPLCVFQFDLFDARGTGPKDLFEVAQREKDIRFSSRTRLNTDRFRERHDIAAAAKRLHDRLPPELRDDPDLLALCDAGPRGAVTLMHLIYRKRNYEGQSKDYEFSRRSMREHWAAGADDAARAIRHPDWVSRKAPTNGLLIFDLGERDRHQKRSRDAASGTRNTRIKKTKG
ncbi:MAG: patatin-like phospholipase family protein [Rhodobacteraceae bacterium]|nr:patatin-like phospholipase family protein [Paracoccaceae bacterium]